MNRNDWLTLLPLVEQTVLERGIPIPAWRAGDEEKRRFRDSVARILAELNLVPDDAHIVEAAEVLARAGTGLGLLQEAASTPGVEEVMVRNGQVWVEVQGEVQPLDVQADDGYFHRLALRVADLGGRAMKTNQPFVLVDLPSGDRFTAMIPPLSVSGTAINVRVFARKHPTLTDLAQTGTFALPTEKDTNIPAADFFPELPPAARFLAWMAAHNPATVLISGEFSSGKTTLLNALLAHVPETTVLAVVETFRELQVQHPCAARAVVPVPARENFPTMSEVVNVLYTRMRPDLIVFGEVVGPEAVELLAAMNLGKKVWTTVHANSAYDALLRLETLAMASRLPLPAIQERIGRGVDLVVHMRRHGSHRYVEEIVLVEGTGQNGRYRLRPIYDARTKTTAGRAQWTGW